VIERVTFFNEESLSNRSKPANGNHTRDIDSEQGLVPLLGMANVLSEEKKQQVLALGQLGWSLGRIQQATGIRRETAGSYPSILDE
jgi:hypothetical protein